MLIIFSPISQASALHDLLLCASPQQPQLPSSTASSSPLTLSAHLQVSYKLTSILAAKLAQEWPALRTATYRVAREWLPAVPRWLCARLLRCGLPA